MKTNTAKLLKISQLDFYALPTVVAANEVLKRTPRGNAENKAAFESIVREMEKYEIPDHAKWAMEDY